MTDDMSEPDPGRAKFNPKDLDQLTASGYRVDTALYFTEGWEIFKSDILGFLSYGIIFFLINTGLSLIPRIGTLASMIISPVLAMGFFIVAAKKKNQEATRFADFFKGFDYLPHLGLVGLVSSLLIALGFFLLILPGIYLFVAYVFSPMLVVDRKLSFWEALETSRKIVNRNWFSLFGLALALLVLNIAGMLAFVIGLVVTSAITFCVLTSAYDDIVGIRSTRF